MSNSRRDILRKVSALPVLAFGLSGVATAADCSGVQQWNPNTAYTGGTRVVYDNVLWEAEWWTWGQEPATSTNVWMKIGECSSGGGGDGDSGDGGDGKELTAVIDASDTTVAVGTEVEFDAVGSTGNIESYSWEINTRRYLARRSRTRLTSLATMKLR